tara:strand:- start:254 stop:610 length:357 start_codon:yes stop_codon:yes gene_type:complete
MEGLINIGIIITYIMIGFAALTAISFGIKKIISNPKNAKKTLYTILGLVIVCLASYYYSHYQIINELDAKIVKDAYLKYEVSAKSAKFVGMGLIVFFILFLTSVGAIIYSELSKVFSK